MPKDESISDGDDRKINEMYIRFKDPSIEFDDIEIEWCFESLRIAVKTIRDLEEVLDRYPHRTP